MASPAACLWTLAARSKQARARPEIAAVPVLCVGNAVAGGAGKTPVALAVAESLVRQGHRPHFLSRGYGGSLAGPVCVDPAVHSAAETGDEPLLLAAAAPAWVARDRAAGARAAAEAGADAIVLDDGFQNTALAYDLSLLVVDGGYGFGNGRVMPAGPLREPVADALARADAVVLLGADTASVERQIAGQKPVHPARFVPVPDPEGPAGQRVVAFAGIGRPAKFYETLAGMGCEIVSTRSFADHHPYTADEVMRIVDLAADQDAVPVTTEKDAMRLPESARPMVRVVRVALEWQAPDAFDRLVASLYARREAAHG